MSKTHNATGGNADAPSMAATMAVMGQQLTDENAHLRALLALGPVVAEGPVQCPTKHGRTWNGGTANSMWPHGYISDYCSDCGTRLQGGEA